MARVQLSADRLLRDARRSTGTARPAAAGRSTTSPTARPCSEVAVDTLTGEYRVERVDILHDCGNSLNPAIDIGQIEGGFIQGMGWLTTEELWWDADGPAAHARAQHLQDPGLRRPPARSSTSRLLDEAQNREDTIHRSKAVGEPPLMLAISVFHAISDAVASVADHRVCPRLDAPATPERVLDAHRARCGEAGAGMTRSTPALQLRDLLPARRAGASLVDGRRRRRARRRARPGAAHAGDRLTPCHRHDRRRPARMGGDRPAPASCWRERRRPRAALDAAARPAVGQCCGGHVHAAADAGGRAELAALTRRRGRRFGRACRWCCCSAPAMSAARWPRRWRPCRCACAGSTTGPTSSPTRRPAASSRCVTDRPLGRDRACPAPAAPASS